MSSNCIAFLGITCHYIDNEWNLKDTLVDFVHLNGVHSGENLAKEFLKCIEDGFHILKKVINFI